ncbi:MAG TPA: EamA family transporter [Polyangiaceae bacterium]|nr:EamA family transporter [Polyangiaceae bacterium]
MRLPGALLGLLAAASFGISAPLAKALLVEIEPVLLAGLLYFGAALGLWGHRLFVGPSREAGLARGDVPLLALVVLAGGVLAPLSMLLGLSRVSALTGSLLLNLEAPLTIALAVLFFGEHLSRRALVAAAFIVLGAAVLRLEGETAAGGVPGILFLAGACALWGLDNNLTQRLSSKDPFAVVRIKTLGAGTFNLVLALFVLRLPWPSWPSVCGALLLGVVSYGLSVVLDAYALRLVGAAREAAYFATAPFMGALTAVVVLGESLHPTDGLALVSMAVGVILLLREQHAHLHTHEELTHDHLHVHDEHHQHPHGADDPPGEPHAHVHHHVRLVHDHPHVSDIHHRHEH